MQVKKSLARSGLPDGIKNVKKRIYSITNVWNNLTETDGKKGDDLCNSKFIKLLPLEVQINNSQTATCVQWNWNGKFNAR